MRHDPPAFEIASLSDVGRQRAIQQDACADFADAGGFHLLVVADGLGGHAGGETASSTAVHAIGEVFAKGPDRDGELLRSALRAANERIFELARERSELRGMGTTAVALLLAEGGRSAWVAHAGDSRAYRLRGRRLRALTQDHSWLENEVRSGRLSPRKASTDPRRNVLLRCLGVEPVVEVEVTRVSARPGDRFVLCSDGLWNAVAADEIAEIVRHNAPAASARALVDLANARGGSDNITVQVAALARPSWPRRRILWTLAISAGGALLALAVRAVALVR